jgi:O-antigen biosynthesis protein
MVETSMPEFNPLDHPNGRAEKDEAQRTIENLSGLLAGRETEVVSLSARLSETETYLNNIVSSRAWRWVNSYGRFKNRIAQSARRLVRRADRADPVALSCPYQEWLRKYDLLTDKDRFAIRISNAVLGYKPLISVVLTLSNVKEESAEVSIEAVRKQLYQNWELCVAESRSAGPGALEALHEFAKEDPRIKIVDWRHDEDFAATTNRAIDMATGEFVVLLDCGGELAEHALYMIAHELNRFSTAELIFTDEDTIDSEGQRSNPHFKTDWNRDLLLSENFVSHVTVYRSSILRQLGGFRSGYEGQEDYDLALRATERMAEHRIRHIPLILYHRHLDHALCPGPGGGENGTSSENARKAIREHFERLRNPATVMAGYQHARRVSYPLPEPIPLVSLIIATRDRADLLRQIIHGVCHETDYDRFEVVIIDNQSTEPETLKYLEEINEDARIKVVAYDAPFNFSAINNLGIRHSQGDVVGFLNNDLKVISPGWLREMVSHAMRPEIGAVGAKLYFPDNTIQHAGVIVGLGGLAGYAYRGLPRDAAGPNCRPHKIQNYCAVTGACMVMRRAVFDEVGGFDEMNLPVAYNDVDLCLRIRERGYRILWTPYAELYHLESASRPPDRACEQLARYNKECAYFKSRWHSHIFHDPYYNPNLTQEAEDFSLASPPRAFKPWKL